MSSNKHHSHCAQYLHWVGNKIHSCGTSLDSWDRNFLIDSHVQLQTFVLVKLTNGTGSGDPEQILSYPATCSGCCRTSTMQRSFLCIFYFRFYNLCIFMLPAPFNSGAVCFWSTPTDKTSAIHHGSNHACHCILHDNWTNMSNTNNITITL